MNIPHHPSASAAEPGPDSKPSGPIRYSHFLIAILFLFAGIVAGRLGSGGPDRAEPSTSKTPEPKSARSRVVTGPWGVLETTRIVLERPDQFIPSGTSSDVTNHWFFENFSENELREFFSQPDLAADQRTALLDARNWGVHTNGIVVTPGRDLILGLSPAARARIYSVLATNASNPFQNLAFRFRSDALDELFDQSGLSPATCDIVRRLFYRQGNAVCFSDLREALSLIPVPEERHRLEKMLSRQSTLLVELRVNHESKVDALANYWGKEGLAKDLRPLLESLVRMPGATTLDVAQLLPPFARMRLNTYPFPSEDPIAKHRDCFWTAMNFFNEQPDDRFCNFEETRRVIRSDYYPIQDEPAFGDVIWFVNSKGTAIHAAVYVAGDILFTKNGAYFNTPWMLMEFDDLRAMYASEEPLRVVAFRLKRT